MQQDIGGLEDAMGVAPKPLMLVCSGKRYCAVRGEEQQGGLGQSRGDEGRDRRELGMAPFNSPPRPLRHYRHPLLC